jgi:4-hydroxybenzoate polyprenyltransferase/phosphoserine phosphatase
LAHLGSNAPRRGHSSLRRHERRHRFSFGSEAATVRVVHAAGPGLEVGASPGLPLVVDLDGTLVRSDLLIETAFSELARRPQSLLDMVAALSRGKAALKHRLAEPTTFDPAVLPYDDNVIARIDQARAENRPVYLASASHERLVSAVADHLGVFDGWFASDETTNLAGEAKANRLVEAFGEGGFDYVGNDAADLPVWSRARTAIAVRAPAGVARKLAGIAPSAEHLTSERPNAKTWAKLIRVHQWAKNALVFLPLLDSHTFEAGAFAHAMLAAIAFSLCASSVYVLNDLIDLPDDRAHRTKCRRPLACGQIPLMSGVLAIPVLLMGSIVVAATVSASFLAVLAVYFVLTTAYSFYLKRVLLVDVFTLASLYTIRVVAGAVAIGAAPSLWLLGFCLSIFLSLALIKRYVELAANLDADLPAPSNRGYNTSDLSMVGALAAAAGFNAVTIFALYLSSDTVHQLYSRPEILWLICPILTHWIGRALILAQRRKMDDDPVIFALRDRQSLATTAVLGLLVIAAV